MGLRNARTTRGSAMFGMIQSTGFMSKQKALSADYTVKASDSGMTFFIDAADLVLTLPATRKGLWFRFVLRAAGLSVGTGLQLSPAAADNIYGNGLTAVDNKDLILAGAGDRAGDSVVLEGDGAAGYAITNVIGTWSKQA
jgi:hypothetical protein